MKTKAIFLFVFVFFIGCVVSSYAASFSAQMEGYYGGSLTISGHYEVIVNPNGDMFDPDMNLTLTYHYNNFSIIPSVSLQGTITDNYSDQSDTETFTGNITVLIGGTPYNVECYCQFNDESDIITPDSYIRINGVSYPASWNLLDIIGQLGMIL